MFSDLSGDLTRDEAIIIDKIKLCNIFMVCQSLDDDFCFSINELNKVKILLKQFLIFLYH